jgi:beta-galactosidase
MKKRSIVFVLAFLVSSVAFAQTVKQTINANWEFHKGDVPGFPLQRPDTVRWEKVSLPHSWNITDVTDDEPGYYRGAGWYKKTIYVPAPWQGRSVYIFFEGANQTAEVYVNGQLAGKHTGGYTAFSFNIGKLLKYGEGLTANEVIVKVDNSHNENIPPLNADFTFFGGIYRDVYLLTADPVHFNKDSDASPGIRITTPKVSEAGADVEVRSEITNSTGESVSLRVISTVFGRDGNEVKEVATKLTVAVNATQEISQQLKDISKPHLWSPGDPYLYRVVSRIYDKSGRLLDELSNPLGFRWFKFDAATGFYLNGKPLKLIGANRHQDYKGMANALPDAIHERDIQLLKDMGANFIRISHYPQDPAVLEACDRLGLLASMEIPVVNRITQTPQFTQNCLNMQREMIRQHFNHPSIIIWAYMNEVLLQPRYKANTPEQEAYFKDVAKIAGQLDSLTRHEDPSRYTMISCHGDFDRYNKAGITKIPQIIGWNLYYGWYAPDLNGFGKFLDRHHTELPDKPLIVTEYGADGDTRLHSFTPERFDKTVEYQVALHKSYLRQIMERPFVAGGAMWCLVDFNSEARIDASPHKNTKGVATDERVPKDIYYYYQANLLKTPVVKIGSRNWTLRSGIAGNDGMCVQPVEVYSNLPEVSLYINGRLLGTQQVKDKVALFNVPFNDGQDLLKASAKQDDSVYEDFANVTFKTVPAMLKDTTLSFKELNVSLGDTRFYVDDKLQQVWLPEQQYTPGGWGYVGGQIFSMKNNGLQRFGSNKNILGTDYDPIYATQRVGLSDFKLDVPDGQYEVTLLFAELLSDKEREASVYDLGSATGQKEHSAVRDFDIYVNGEKVTESLGNENYLVPERAYSIRYTIDVVGGKGVDVSFKPLKGEAILNGIQVKRVF